MEKIIRKNKKFKLIFMVIIFATFCIALNVEKKELKKSHSVKRYFIQIRPGQELLECDENKTYITNLTIQNQINPRILHLRIKPINFCDKDRPFPLIVYVFNHVDNFEKRRVIRSTWASKSFFPHLKLVFILGYSHDQEINKRLFLESNQHNDIVQGTFLVIDF